VRDVDNVRHRWNYKHSKAKSDASRIISNRKKTGGGPPDPGLSDETEKILNIIGQDNPSVLGIQGGIEAGVDPEMDYQSNNSATDFDIYVTNTIDDTSSSKIINNLIRVS
jgi:hypothetical protein